MKQSWFHTSTFAVALISSAASAESIVCQSEHGDLATFTRTAENRATAEKAQYKVRVAEALSSSYLGPITDDYPRLVGVSKQESTATQALLSDWDGNSGIEIKVPWTVVREPEAFAEKTFKTRLKVFYNDIAEDEVTTDVVCSVK